MLGLKKTIAALSQSDLEAVRDYCNLLLGSTAVVSGYAKPTPAKAPGKAVRREEMHVTLLYIAVSKLLEQQFHKAVQPAELFMRMPDRKRMLVSAADLLTQFCDRNLPKYSSSIFSSVCLRFVQYSAEDLQTFGAPVTPKTLLQAADRWEDTLDRRFPGYLAAGMIGIVFRSSNNGLHSASKKINGINRLHKA